MQSLNLEKERWVFNTWRSYPPDWFVTILWNDMPSDPITTSSHTRHLRNVLLCQSSGVRKCSSVPELPHRLGMTTYQERTLTKKGKVVYHTHLHLFNTDGKWLSPFDLHFFIRYQIGKRVVKLLKTDTEENKGVVVKKWSSDYHQTYNLKENQRQLKKAYSLNPRYAQDADLTLDYKNSDFIPYDQSVYTIKKLSSNHVD